MAFVIWAFVFLLPISHTIAENINDPFAVAQNPCDQIRNAQFICINCATLGYCTQINGAWITAEVGSCTNGFFCDEDAKKCTYSRQCNLGNQGPPFECQNPGIYPDPYNCKYYHECNQRNELKTTSCNNGMGYSLQTGTCSLSKSSKECQERQYKCDSFGQVGVWPSDDNIFYICAQQLDSTSDVYPILYRCPVGQTLENNKCVPKTDNTTTECKKNSLVADPTDCRKYHRCGEICLDQDRCTCAFGTHFDAIKESCVIGSC